MTTRTAEKGSPTKRLLALFLALAAALLSVVISPGTTFAEPTPKGTYTITWKFDDDTIIDMTEVASGEMPTHSDPAKDPDAQYTYTFTGWDPEVIAATGNAEYKATFKRAIRTYAITWLNWDNSVLQSGEVAYGEIPSYGGEEPTKPKTDEFTYTFSGWEPEIAEVTGEATYTAKYTAEKRKYAITWKDDDGSVIGMTTVEYGDTPAHGDPAKPETDEFTYTFSGWEPEIAEVTGDATYTAKYTAEKRKYAIIWKDDDGSELQSGEVAYGETPKYTGKEPAKASDEKYSYTFSGWDPEVAEVTGGATYTAKYTATPKDTPEYKVVSGAGGTWTEGSGAPMTFKIERTVDPETAFGHFTGILVDGKAVPEKDASGRANWTARSGSVIVELQPSYLATLSEGAHTLAALFDDGDPVVADFTVEASTHTVTFDANGHGTAPAAQEVEDGKKAERPSDPTASGYIFGGWCADKACTKAYDFSAPVTSDITLYAKWTAVHKVTFDANGHGTAPAVQEVEDGKAATRPANPTASGYTFGGWYADKACTKAYDFKTPVTEDITLYAKWTKKSTAATSPRTGDPTGGTVVALSATAAAALCLALLALRRCRRRG